MADSIVIPLGKDAQLYYAAPGVNPTVSSVKIDGAVDVTITLEKDEAEVTRRRSAGWEDVRDSIKRLRLSFNIANVVIDYAGNEATAISDLRTTFLSGLYQGSGNTGIRFHAIERTGGQGPRADFIITRFDRTETLGEMQTYAVEARMNQAQNYQPEWTALQV